MYKIFKYLFFMFYAIGKHILSHTSNGKNNFIELIKKSLSVIFGVGVLMIFTLLATPFIAFYICLHTILKFLYGDLYGGLLNGIDMIFEIKPQKTVINVVLIFSCLDNTDDFIKKLKQRANQLHQSYYKFGSEIRTVLGYRYFLKNRVSFEEITEIAKFNNRKYMTKENLIDYLEQKCSTIVKNQMWKAVFFSQPILWNMHKKDKQLAVILTFRHALGDFPSILGFIKNHFLSRDDTNLQIMSPITYDLNLNLDNVCVGWHPFNVLQNRIYWQEWSNPNYLVATYIEQNVECIPKVRRIKNKLNVTFMEVFVTAISTSIYEYALQRNIKIKNLTLGTVVRPLKDHLEEIVNATYNFQELANTLGCLIYTIPFKSKEINLKTTLSDIHYRYNTSEYSMDNYIMFAAYNYFCSFLPESLIRLFNYVFADRFIFGISNVVGLSRSTCCGYTIDDMFFYASNFMEMGFSFFIHSYAGRIQFTMVSKSGYVRSREDLQQIVENTFKNIDKLAKDIDMT